VIEASQLVVLDSGKCALLMISARMWDATYQHAIQQRILEDDPIASPRSSQAKRDTFAECQAFDATLEGK